MLENTEQATEQRNKLGNNTTRYVHCTKCGSEIEPPERGLITSLCKKCGEAQAREQKHCVVPMHKSNYVLVMDRDLLTGVNQKGGLVK